MVMMISNKNTTQLLSAESARTPPCHPLKREDAAGRGAPCRRRGRGACGARAAGMGRWTCGHGCDVSFVEGHTSDRRAAGRRPRVVAARAAPQRVT